jgi:hypothetical protein
MDTTPSLDQVALEAARFATREYTSLASWEYHEAELVPHLLADTGFVCMAEYAIRRTMEHMRHNRQMQARSAQAGGGALGNAQVAGMVLGAWLGGGTTIDREVDSW